MPTKQLETKDLVENVIRLRRLEREAAESVRNEIQSVLSYLEGVAGPTVSRAEAARLFGVSQTALDRWIAKGEISSVLTPRGRREVPLVEVVGLLEQLQETSEGSDPLALASVIRGRRRVAQEIDPETIFPSRRRPRLTHRRAELVSLAYHRAVALRLDDRLVRDAWKRLAKWRDSGAIDSRWADEWEHVLELPVAKIAKLISSDSERSREVRQSSPFAGVLTQQERRRLLRLVDDRVND